MLELLRVTDGLVEHPLHLPKINVPALILPPVREEFCEILVPANSSSVPFGKLITLLFKLPASKLRVVPASSVNLFVVVELM